MTTLTMEAGAATSLQMTIESGEVNITGNPGGSQITLSYGYFAGQQEVLQDRSMDPELRADGPSAIILRQTPDQAGRARQVNAHIRLRLGIPALMSLAQSRMESATLLVNGINGVDLAMKSGTLDAAGNSGLYVLTVTSGTVRVADPAMDFHHQITVQAGTIVLAAGVLLPLVTAEVEQGVIQGGQGGRLEQLGVSGWKLTPIHPDPRSSVECRVVSGSIAIRQA
jgi:hypothetical protein